MYDFTEIGGRELNRKNVLRLVSEDRLWRHYLGFSFVIGKTYKSPLRTDPTPSFSIYENALGKIKAFDHGGGFAGDIIDYLQFTEHIDFYSALVKINNDFDLGLSYKRDRTMTFTEHKATTIDVRTSPKRTGVMYECVQRTALEADLGYWASYGITRGTLNLYGVRCVGLLRCNGVCCYTYQTENPCYMYPFPSGNAKYYWPYADKASKFRGNIDNGKDIQGYHQCRMDKSNPGELLVLTKSLKDVMLFREYGIEAIAIHGETHKFNKDFIRHIRERYKVIVSLYDRDKSGMTGAKYLWKEYGVIPLFTPKGTGKDLTDMFKKEGKMKVDEFVEGRIRRLTQPTRQQCVQ